MTGRELVDATSTGDHNRDSLLIALTSGVEGPGVQSEDYVAFLVDATGSSGGAHLVLFSPIMTSLGKDVVFVLAALNNTYNHVAYICRLNIHYRKTAAGANMAMISRAGPGVDAVVVSYTGKDKDYLELLWMEAPHAGAGLPLPSGWKYGKCRREVDVAEAGFEVLMGNDTPPVSGEMLDVDEDLEIQEPVGKKEEK
jgi:hypothetical protein